MEDAMETAYAARTLMEWLVLDTHPIALAFRDAPPEECEISEDAVPSACSFCRKAESGLIFAPAQAHHNCPIGAMVMGFDLPDRISQQLMQMVEVMTACGYVRGTEPAHLPANPKPGAKGVLYGPLSDFPSPPDVILAWLTPAQAMLWNEATGDAEWDAGTTPLVTGRPACAAIPVSLHQERPALSLGCAGMRTFTSIGDERLLAVLPGSAMATFCDEIARTGEANAKMKTIYNDRLAGIGAGHNLP
jgi:uncharacterized protein (DUF169 family)